MARKSLLIAALVASLGWLGLGAGPVNGDAAIYAWQVDSGLLTERTVHIGYLVLAWAVGSNALDLLTVVAAAGLCLGAGRWSGAWVSAAVVGAAVLPLASFAEVDVLWACAISWVLATRNRWGSAVWAAVAMSLSPMTLLTLPWVLYQRRDWRLVAICVLTVVAITGIGSGDWWIGGRGVLHGPPLLPGRTAQAWLWHLPWLMLPLTASAELRGNAVALLPLLLAPPDVGGWLIGALCIGHLSRRGWDGSAIAALLLLSTCTWGLIQRHTELERVQLENTQIAATVASMGEADGLEASWSVGVRASILAGKGPYGLAWRKPGEPWRASPPTGAIHTFPPP